MIRWISDTRIGLIAGGVYREYDTGGNPPPAINTTLSSEIAAVDGKVVVCEAGADLMDLPFPVATVTNVPHKESKVIDRYRKHPQG